MKRYYFNIFTATVLTVSLLFLGLSPVLADDSDIFGANIQPNVMLLIDSSGSMKNEISSSIYASATTYSSTYTSTVVYSLSGGIYSLYKNTVAEVPDVNARTALSAAGYWVGRIGGTTVSLFFGNYLNYLDCTTCAVDERKIDIAKRVYSNIVKYVEGVRFGVMRLRSNGGAMVAEIGTDRATMVSAIDNMANFGGVGTALGDELYDAGRYFKGTFCPDGNCEEASAYATPIQLECQPNFIILMSDGKHNSYIRDVRDEATLRFTEDHSSSLTGLQNVTVHTIGFDISGNQVANDVLITAAANGGGSFFAADNSAQLEIVLQEAIRQIVESVFTFASPVVPTTSATGSTRAYIASFQSDAKKPFWRGFLKAFDRDTNGNIRLNADGTPDANFLAWESGDLLSRSHTDGDGVQRGTAASRKIYFNEGSSRKDFLKTTSSLSAGNLGVSTTTERDQLIDFIRGLDAYDDDGDEVTTEERAWKLGDIYHSTPVLVSPPLLPLTEQSYVDFKTAKNGRETVLIVGANDGMIHAFRESDGEELWAWIPGDLLGGLKDLAANSGQHRFFVDSSPIAVDIHVSSGGSKQWKTIVIFGLRRGGRYYYALDITDTEDPKFLWTFTDAKMGETWSEMAIGAIDKGNGDILGFVGGGFNSSENNSLGKAFFVIDLANGNLVWEYYADGTNDDRQYMNYSLAANPTAVDTNGDGFIDVVYIGDIGGQLWKFNHSGLSEAKVISYKYEFVDKYSVTLQRDFTRELGKNVTDLPLKLASEVPGASAPVGCTADCYAYSIEGADPTSVSPSKLGYVGGLDSINYGSGHELTGLNLLAENKISGGWSGKRLFVADSSEANPPAAGEFFAAQPFYGAPSVSLDDKGNLWIYIGTGDRNHPLNTSTNRFYAIKDDTDMTNGNVLTELDLLEVDSNVTSVSDTVQGWFFILGSDEKVLAAADVFNNIVFFSTFTPGTTALCGSGGGTAKLYAVQTVTGFAAMDMITGDALASTDGSVTRSTVIGTGIPSKPTVIIDPYGNPSIITGTTSQQISSVPAPALSLRTLLGWREVF